MNNRYLAATLAYTDDFLPNEDETAALAATPEALKQIVDGALVVKRGARGASAYTANAGGDISEAQVPAFPVTPIDTTGAGDAFNAGYLYALRVRGETMSVALRFSAACGAQATQHIGGATAAPSERSIHELITQWEYKK